MGKPAHPRTFAESQARAVGRSIRVSPRKLNLVAQSIRGKSAEAALATLTFSPKRIADDVKKILQSAIANAENNHDLDVDDLIVSEASVGRNITMKRFHARARGRAGRIEKPFSQITIVVEEKSRKDAIRKAQTKKPSAAKAPASNDSEVAEATTDTATAAPEKKTAAKKSSAGTKSAPKSKSSAGEGKKKSGKRKETN